MQTTAKKQTTSISLLKSFICGLLAAYIGNEQGVVNRSAVKRKVAGRGDLVHIQWVSQNLVIVSRDGRESRD